MKINTNELYRAVSLAAVFWTTVSMSAYTPHETGSRTTASGAKAKEGYTCAANFVPLGSVIIYDGHKYVVQDRMNPKYNRHVDIFMESHEKALQFGRKEAKVQVITADNGHVKLPKDNKDNKTTSRDNKETETKKEHNQYTETQDTKTRNTVNTPRPNSPAASPVLKPQAKP